MATDRNMRFAGELLRIARRIVAFKTGAFLNKCCEYCSGGKNAATLRKDNPALYQKAAQFVETVVRRLEYWSKFGREENQRFREWIWGNIERNGMNTSLFRGFDTTYQGSFPELSEPRMESIHDSYALFLDYEKKSQLNDMTKPVARRLLSNSADFIRYDEFQDKVSDIEDYCDEHFENVISDQTEEDAWNEIDRGARDVGDGYKCYEFGSDGQRLLSIVAGEKTEWCVAKRGNSGRTYYEDYGAPYWMYYHARTPYALLNLESTQFKDVNDDPVSGADCAPAVLDDATAIIKGECSEYCSLSELVRSDNPRLDKVIQDNIDALNHMYDTSGYGNDFEAIGVFVKSGYDRDKLLKELFSNIPSSYMEPDELSRIVLESGDDDAKLAVVNAGILRRTQDIVKDYYADAVNHDNLKQLVDMISAQLMDDDMIYDVLSNTMWQMKYPGGVKQELFLRGIQQLPENRAIELVERLPEISGDEHDEQLYVVFSHFIQKIGQLNRLSRKVLDVFLREFRNGFNADACGITIGRALALCSHSDENWNELLLDTTRKSLSDMAKYHCVSASSAYTFPRYGKSVISIVLSISDADLRSQAFVRYCVPKINVELLEWTILLLGNRIPEDFRPAFSAAAIHVGALIPDQNSGEMKALSELLQPYRPWLKNLLPSGICDIPGINC